MADITVRNQGEVDDSGKVNWRGDQVTVPQGGQSIYKSSTVQLAQLGSRKVVGDRVFRYARAGLAVTAGKFQKTDKGILKETIAGATGTVGDKTFVYSAANTIGANSFAEGYLLCNSGAALTGGNVYRIKSHSDISSAGTGTLTLYDPLVVAVTASAEYSIVGNQYSKLTEISRDMSRETEKKLVGLGSEILEQMTIFGSRHGAQLQLNAKHLLLAI